MPNLPRLDGVRVLVVDDEPDAREAIGAVLEQCGAVVTPAPSVAAALDALASATPNVVVSDIAMPAEDGYALIQGIRSRGPDRGGDVPALALTAYASADDRRRIADAGFQGHLTKPIEAAQLVNAVARLTGRK
jgi:CheY-like chemotaxis protein